MAAEAVTDIVLDCPLDATPEREKEVKSPEGTPLRRSTRASAMRATEKLRGNEAIKDLVNPFGSSLKRDSDLGSEEDLSEKLVQEIEPEIVSEAKKLGKTDEPLPKKRRLADPRFLDPTDPHFAIQQTEDGEVVVLSDDSEVSSLNDEELTFIRKNYEKLACQELSEEVREERLRMIRKLKAELRCEEAKLMYLKKLRLAQHIAREPPQVVHPSLASRPTVLPQLRPGNHVAAVQGSVYKTNAPGVQPHVQQQTVSARHPFPQVGQGQRAPPAVQQRHAAPRGGGGPATVHHGGHSVRPSNIQPTPAHQGTKSNLHMSVAPHHTPGSGRTNANNLVAPTAGMTGVAKAPAAPTAQDLQTAAQKQAAAKLALRKQLEKTLLQIPPPKPPPPEMHFVPNPNQPDFVCLVGLDYIVQRLEESKREKEKRKEAAAVASEAKAVVEGEAAATATEQAAVATQSGPQETGVKQEERPPVAAEAGPVVPKQVSVDADPPPPFSCSQCGTDFTTLWKFVTPENNKSEKQQVVMCETCVRTNQKKALKMEHTNRLKQAFVKALQQEQEIEQKIKDGTFMGLDSSSSATAPLAASSSKSSTAHAQSAAQSQSSHSAAAAAASIRSQQQQQQSASVAAATAAAAAAFQPNFSAAAALNLQASMFAWNPLFAAAAARFPAGFTNPAALFPNLPNLSKDFMKNLQQQSSAMQRQILMDMMPRPKHQQQFK